MELNIDIVLDDRFDLEFISLERDRFDHDM